MIRTAMLLPVVVLALVSCSDPVSPDLQYCIDTAQGTWVGALDGDPLTVSLECESPLFLATTWSWREFRDVHSLDATLLRGFDNNPADIRITLVFTQPSELADCFLTNSLEAVIVSADRLEGTFDTLAFGLGDPDCTLFIDLEEVPVALTRVPTI